MAQPLTVLVVDDDPEMVRLIGLIFARKFPDARFLGAVGGVEAISLAVEARPDVTLIDDMMPFPTGYEVVDTLRLKRIPTRAIMMTARPITPHLLVSLARVGVCDYLQKPFHPDELIASVRRALAAADLTVTGSLTPLVDQILLRVEYPEYDRVLRTHAAPVNLGQN